MLSISMFCYMCGFVLFFNGWDCPAEKAQFPFCEQLEPEIWTAGQSERCFFLGGSWALGKTGFQNAKWEGRKVKRERNLQHKGVVGRARSRNTSCRDVGKRLPREPEGNVVSLLQCRKQLCCRMESHPKGNPSICEDAVGRLPTVFHFYFLSVRLLFFKKFKF